MKLHQTIHLALSILLLLVLWDFACSESSAADVTLRAGIVKGGCLDSGFEEEVYFLSGENPGNRLDWFLGVFRDVGSTHPAGSHHLVNLSATADLSEEEIAANQKNETILSKLIADTERAGDLAESGEIRMADELLDRVERRLNNLFEPVSEEHTERVVDLLQKVNQKVYRFDAISKRLQEAIDAGDLQEVIREAEVLDKNFSNRSEIDAVFEDLSVFTDAEITRFIDEGSVAKAVDFKREVVERIELLQEHSSANLIIGSYYLDLGDALVAEGKRDEAVEAYEEARAVLDREKSRPESRDEKLRLVENGLNEIASERSRKLFALVGLGLLFVFGGGVGFWLGEVAVNAQDRDRRFVFERVGLLFAIPFQLFSEMSNRIQNRLSAEIQDSDSFGKLLYGVLWLLAVVFVTIPGLILCFLVLCALLWMTVPVCIVAVILFIPLRTIHFFWLWMSRQRYVCPNLECRQEGGEAMPIYECECGYKYDKFYPNFYGLFTHLCSNTSGHRKGRNFRLPTLEVFRRPLDLKRYCPDPSCKAELVTGRAEHCPILVFGGESSGKTVFVFQALYSIIEKVNKVKGGHAELVGKHTDAVRKIFDDLQKGIRPPKTAGTLFHAIGIRVELPGHRRAKLIQLYDVDGMRFLRIEDILKMQAIEKISGIVFLVDPFSLPELCWEAETVQNDDSPSESPVLNLIDNLGQGARHLLLKGKLGRKTQVPLAVVMGKIDAVTKSQHPWVEQVHADGKKLSDASPEEIFKGLGLTGILNPLEQIFDKVGHFTCSGLGRSATSHRGAPFRSVGVLDPVRWISIPDL